MQIRMTPVRVAVVGVLAAGVAAWFVVDWLVVTEEDKVGAVVDRLAEQVENRRIDAIVAGLDDNFTLGTLRLAELRPWLHEFYTRYDDVHVTSLDRSVTIADNVATAEVQSYVEGGPIARTLRIDWTLEFVRSGEGWKLKRIRGWSMPGHREIPFRMLFDFAAQ